jgi:hypothetical protein
MSSRAQYPKARLPDTHFFVTFARGDNARCFAIKPGILWSLAALLPLLGAWYLGATLYLIFRDDMLASLMKRQTDMQYAYEDRLAGMRAHLDRVTSRQLLDQGTFEGKVHDLLSRQAKLESRAAVVATLANQVSFGDVTGSTPKPSGVKASAPPITTFMPVTGPAVGGPLPGGALGFAPADAPVFPAKPRPESFELRSWHAPGAVAPTTTETVADAAPPETLPRAAWRGIQHARQHRAPADRRHVADGKARRDLRRPAAPGLRRSRPVARAHERAESRPLRHGRPLHPPQGRRRRLAVRAGGGQTSGGAQIGREAARARALCAAAQAPARRRRDLELRLARRSVLRPRRHAFRRCAGPSPSDRAAARRSGSGGPSRCRSWPAAPALAAASRFCSSCS